MVVAGELWVIVVWWWWSVVFFFFFLLILWRFSGGGDGFGGFFMFCGFLGMFFMFKICVNGERQIPLFDLVSLAFLFYFLF